MSWQPINYQSKQNLLLKIILIKKNMGLPTFTDIISLSNKSEAIIETENKLFNLISKSYSSKFLSHMK
jgi:hypothetical protein